MWWFVCIVIGCALVARGGVPTTLPATTQPGLEFQADSPVRGWFRDLASPDNAKRDEARTQLMGLSREDLPRLKELVEKNQPLVVEQAAALHEIVVHVYLSGETYPQDTSKQGFLGLSWSPKMDEDSLRLGVPVENRLPGFPSFQMLRTGDLILGVLLRPDLPPQELPNIRTPSLRVMKQVISAAGANRDVVLEVLRQGQVLRVPLKLDPRPFLLLTEVDSFSAERLQKGEEYWQQEFVPLLRAGIS
jgi:hypothetical protein